MAEMHTLIVDGNDYEIVDASSRERLDGHDSDIQGKADANTAGAAIKAAAIPCSLSTTLNCAMRP